jgi:hypothetical protein
MRRQAMDVFAKLDLRETAQCTCCTESTNALPYSSEPGAH